MAHKSIWEAEVDPSTIAKAGTLAVLPLVWSVTDGPDHDMTPGRDIPLMLLEDMTYEKVLESLEAAALAYVGFHGATRLRQYYIEIVEHEGDLLVFRYGT